MDNNTKITIKKFNPTLRLVVSAVVLFLAVIMFAPEAGILRTIPFLFVAGIAVGVMGTQIVMSVSISAVFCACVYFVRGSSLVETLVFTLLAAVLVFAGIYVVKLCAVAKKTEKKDVRKKCVILCAAAVILSFVLSLIMCGNPISYVKSDSDNTSHIVFVNKHLGADSVKKEYTSYNALSGEYRTYVGFEDDNDVVGADNDCYICIKNGKLTDNVRDYYEDKMLDQAEKTLSSAVVKATSAFEVTASDIVFENEELVLPDENYTCYGSRIGYVVSFYSILDDENDFLSLCEDVMKQLENAAFEYKEIVFCGGNASEVLYAAQLLPGMDYNTLISKYSDSFDSFKHVNLEEQYGVNEELILDYWNNK